MIRRAAPPVDLKAVFNIDPKAPVTLEHLAALSLLQGTRGATPQSLLKNYDALTHRVWRTNDDKELYGAVVEVDVGGIRIADKYNPRLNQGAGRLDDASVQLVCQDLLQIRRNHRPSLRMDAKWTATKGVGGAINKFYYDFGCLPPWALVDAKGTPLLSWRVLVLPYLGYENLFSLFRLDEPWNSPHNRKLLPYMPLEYAPIMTKRGTRKPIPENRRQTPDALAEARKLPPGKTVLKAFVGPRAAFPLQGRRRYHHFHEDRKHALMIGEVASTEAVEWTRPADIEVTDSGAVVRRLFAREILDYRQFVYAVIFGDGEFIAIPASVDEQSLLGAVLIDDGQPSNLRK